MRRRAAATSELRAAAEAFGAWMTGAALPLWCAAGHAGPGLGFVDELDARGRPVWFERHGEEGAREERVPATSPYRLFVACAELSRAARSGKLDGAR